MGAFSGLLVVEAVFQTKALKAEGTPMVIASFVSCSSIWCQAHGKPSRAK